MKNFLYQITIIFFILLLITFLQSCENNIEPAEDKFPKEHKLLYSNFSNLLIYNLDAQIIDTLVSPGDTIKFDTNPSANFYQNRYSRFARWSNDGELIAFIESYAADEEHISIINKDRVKKKSFLSSRSSNIISLNWNSNNSNIVYSKAVGRTGNYFIYVLDIYTGNSIQLTTMLPYNICPDYTYDDEKLILSSKDSSGTIQLFIMNFDGSSVEQLINSDKDIILQDCSPNENKILISQKDQDGDNELFIMQLDTKEINKLTNNTKHDLFGKWSNDGKNIIFIRYQEMISKPEVYTINPNEMDEKFLLGVDEIIAPDLFVIY